jgi:hypothetical protein
MMKLSILLRTDMNMGDHGVVSAIAYDPVEGEMVDDMVRRIFTKHYHLNNLYSSRKPNPFDVIELRLVVDGGEVEPWEAPDAQF